MMYKCSPVGSYVKLGNKHICQAGNDKTAKWIASRLNRCDELDKKLSKIKNKLDKCVLYKISTEGLISLVIDLKVFI